MIGDFLVGRRANVSYERLLSNLSKKRSYKEYYQVDDLSLFYENFLAAIITGNPITLIDSDISSIELNSLNLSSIGEETMIEVLPISNVEELLERVKSSESTIYIFTSGTTGQPKKVGHSVKSLTRGVRKSDKHISDVWGLAYNPTHMAGLQVFFQALFNGNKIVDIFRMGRNEVMDMISANGITHISATPTFYRLLKPFETSFPSVQRITLGGEKSDEALYKGLATMFPNASLTNVYASTEAGTLLTSVGANFVIKDAFKHLFKVDGGELLVHRSLVGESASFSFDGDYYRTGDLIEWVDEEKLIFRFLSRKNELINVGGYKVNPSETEDAIRSIKGIKNVLVYGRKNSVLGNVLCADVEKELGADIDVVSILGALKENLQDFKIPRRIKFVDQIEMTRTGKIKRLN